MGTFSPTDGASTTLSETMKQLLVNDQWWATTQIIMEKDAAVDGSADYEYPAGCAVANYTAAATKFGPYDDGAADGTEVAEYILAVPVDLYNGTSTRTDTYATVFLYAHLDESACTQVNGEALHANGKANLIFGGAGLGNYFFS